VRNPKITHTIVTFRELTHIHLIELVIIA